MKVVKPLAVLGIVLSLNLMCVTAVGPNVIATKGAVMPKPQSQTSTTSYFTLGSEFSFKVSNVQCDFISDAIGRYMAILTIPTSDTVDQENLVDDTNDINDLGVLNSINLNVESHCETIPHAHMDEEYYLTISQNGSEIRGKTVWGVMRGMETFSQLIYRVAPSIFRINETDVHDFPRFTHRGILLDTGRHFENQYTIELLLQSMEYNKMNVLHWHIVDDQSFPYESTMYPDLSGKGAYHPTLVYNVPMMKYLELFARQRGIRIMLEFDTPAHATSWLGQPNLLTPCFGGYGSVNPTLEENYEFFQNFFAEAQTIFHDQYLHLGGDELDYSCWKNNANIADFMKQNNLSTYNDLESYYFNRLHEITTNLSYTPVVWEEVFENVSPLDTEFIVQIWSGDYNSKMKSVVDSGHQALLSACWYLDHIDDTWNDYYVCEPTAPLTTDEEKSLVLGGEACMWGESINEANVIARIWPRASAVAERLWSAQNVTDHYDASKRIEEHACRLNLRGIPAQPPNGPGFCVDA